MTLLAGEDPDALIEDIAGTADQLRDEARARLGVTGDRNTAPLRTVLRERGLSLYPLSALGVLALVDTFQFYGFQVLTPDISLSLGISFGLIGAVITLRGLAQVAAPLPMAALAHGKGHRGLLCLLTAFGWSILTLFTGFVTSVLGLLLVLVADGLTTGSAAALHQPLLMDTYHPSVRVRVISLFTAFGRIGEVLSPLLVGLLAGPLHLTWRGVFITMGAVSTLSALAALGLRDPGVGKWDTDQLRAAVHELHGESTELPSEQVELGFFEICRRLLAIPTVRRLMAGFTVLGLLSAPLGIFLSFHLERRWGLQAGSRGLFFAYQSLAMVISLMIYGSRGEKQFRSNPAAVVTTAAAFLAGGLVFLAVGGLSPYFWLMIVGFGGQAACFAVIGPALGVALLSIVPAHMRPHTAGLLGIFGAAGGIAGALLLSTAYRDYGAPGSVVAIVIPGLLAAAVISTAGQYVSGDLDRMIDEVLEDEEITRITSSGGHLPMLACRGIDFSYGQLQVLFDVDFTVDEGEMVALLGVNGAGKSTLLKVISGIGLPSRGSVRYQGQDITFLDAERRVNLGITQIPGGRAVFGPLTVIENLRTFGYASPWNARELDEKIDQCLAAFPRLEQRQNSLASQLSGGEQQMLGLSKALILNPKLLVIDELSLGLAPVIVGQLLDMVRRINAEGTAVVLVEQSVNIALNLVDHAYFMEKGEMRFDGPARDLLLRDDLLRAVFLAGAAATPKAP